MKYFEEILEINREVMKDNFDNIRLTDLEEVYTKLDAFYNKEFDLDEFIKLCILLFNMQIFFDGNSRTIFAYLIKTINKYGYCLDAEKATEGLTKLKGLFPAMYDLNEELDDYDVLKIKQYVYLQKDNKTRK